MKLELVYTILIPVFVHETGISVQHINTQMCVFMKVELVYNILMPVCVRETGISVYLFI